MIKRTVEFLFSNALLLIVGAAAGLVWANVAPEAYLSFRDMRLTIGWPGHEAVGGISLHYLVNDILMAFFFALTGKEVWEAMLPGGSLREFRRAATPVLCAVGGMTGPAVIYTLGALCVGQLTGLGRGWAIPCATDVAFSYLVARMIFGKGHPAVPFLLLLAIADDALGLVVLAVFYPVSPVQPVWLMLPVGAVLLGLAFRRAGVKSFWWYLAVPGVISWTGFAFSGLHPALGLLPIIPTLPHGRFAETPMQWGATDGKYALDQLESWWSKPVELILGLFALLNAGVMLGASGTPTYLVTAALVVGKPIGITLTGVLATRLLGLRLSERIGMKELVVAGCAAGIGFTVAIFVATVAFAPGSVQDAAKMGALCSCVAGLIAIVVGKVLGIRRETGEGRG